jgi:hypothetical protein
MAGLAASHPNVETRVLTLFADEADRWNAAMKENGFTVTFHEDGKATHRLMDQPNLVTKDPAAAQGVDMIIFVVPAFGHAQYLQAIEPYIEPGMTLVATPGQAGFEFDVRGNLGEKAKGLSLMSFESLPWACRIKTYGTEVHVLGTKKELQGAVFIGNVKPRVQPHQTLQLLIGERPKLTVTGHILGMTLMGDICHGPILYARWKEWDGKETFEEAPIFYQGLDEFGADKMAACSEECLAVAKCIMDKYPDVDLKNCIHIFDWIKKCYPDEVQDKSSLHKAFQTNKAYIGLTHPMTPDAEDPTRFVPDFNHRYFREDIPINLVTLVGIGEVLGVPCPAMVEIITWAQKHMQKEYLVDGKVCGKDVDGTRAPQRYGFTTMEQLIGK